MTFAEGGGYERREWWSAEGWSWKLDQDMESPESASDGDLAAAVVHVSYHEAEAFARSVNARLPTELEWEKAALQGRLAGIGSAWEWTQSRFSGYPGLRPSVPRVLGGLLRRRLPRAPRRLARHPPARRLPALPQLGPPRAPPALCRNPDRALTAHV